MAQPNRKFAHVFVVVRLPKKISATAGDATVEDDVMLTKAFFQQEDAEEEATRLNELNKEFWHYFVSVARLVDDR